MKFKTSNPLKTACLVPLAALWLASAPVQAQTSPAPAPANASTAATGMATSPSATATVVITGNPLGSTALAQPSTVLSGDALCQDGVDWKVLRDYQKQRVCTLLDPSRDPLGKGFHIIQGMIAIGSGGLSGKGFMQGTQTHLEFIPERTTDFIFAAFSEEFGLAGVVVLLVAFTFLIFRGLMIAADAPTVFTRLLAGAMTLSLFSYAFVNMGMVSGILPVVGVPLPFISYGGTAMVSLGLALGILMSVARSRRLMQS